MQGALRIPGLTTKSFAIFLTVDIVWKDQGAVQKNCKSIHKKLGGFWKILFCFTLMKTSINYINIVKVKNCKIRKKNLSCYFCFVRNAHDFKRKNIRTCYTELPAFLKLGSKEFCGCCYSMGRHRENILIF